MSAGVIVILIGCVSLAVGAAVGRYEEFVRRLRGKF